jgi:two-component system response regulator HupR/HoxA
MRASLRYVPPGGDVPYWPMSVALDYKTYPILFVDDEQPLIETLRLNYERDFTVLAATGGSQALAVVASQPVAVLVADQRMPEMSGLEVIKRALDLKPDLIPIILTGYTDVETLVGAINLGRIYRYIPKPFDSRELRMALESAIETFHLVRENVRLAQDNLRLLQDLQAANERLAIENGYFRKREADESGFRAILGRSQAIQHVIALARRVLATPTTVLLEGPTGTGKELMARAIHHEGSRRDKLFVPQNCGAVSETLLASELFGHRRGSFTGAVADKKGLFEIADGGTLFLDEIAETSPAVQVHLLRVLQEGEVKPVGAARPMQVDVRVIVATNRDLAAEVQSGRFREDLYFRLNVFRICMPALRERREDIPVLAEHFLQKHSRALGRRVTAITPEALDALTRLDFPGNIRELDHMIERAVLLCDPGGCITEAELFDDSHEANGARPEGAPISLQDDVTRFECERIRLAIERCDGNRTHAARELGLTYRGLLKKMQRYGLLAAGGKRLE